jgi:hypothetical protein
MPATSGQTEDGADSTYIIVTLNERLQPMHRDRYEDPLQEDLEAAGLGDVTGGGTQLGENREIEFCNIDIDVSGDLLAAATLIATKLEELGAAKGSKLLIGATGEEVTFGRNDGLALYLNGTDLPGDVYEACDVNYVIDECHRLLGNLGEMHSHWTGPTETALYFYGPSFGAMSAALKAFLATYPLCQKSRMVQIA